MVEDTPEDAQLPGGMPARSKRHGMVAWIATAVTLATYFGLMLTVALAPSLLTKTIVTGSSISIGIVAGVIIIIFLIAVSAVFTIWINKLDQSP